jgi:hypothetical protein
MRIETKEINNKKIITDVDDEDNSIDISVIIDGNPDVTLNVSVDEKKILIRKWVGYGDSVDEVIYLDEIE